MNPDLPLKDIHLPPPLGWWPLAPGWWLLLAALVGLLAAGVWLYRRLTRPTAVKAAARALRELRQDPAQDSARQLVALSALFRRTALSLYPRETCASLSGEAWLAFLQAPLNDRRFTDGVGRLLADAPYRPIAPDAETLRQLFALFEDWLKAAAKAQKC